MKKPSSETIPVKGTEQSFPVVTVLTYAHKLFLNLEPVDEILTCSHLTGKKATTEAFGNFF